MLNLVLHTILVVVSYILFGIAWIEQAVRGLLTGTGIPPQLQSFLMLGVAVLLILTAFRLFGGLLAFLCMLFLLLLVVHILAPGVLDPYQHV